MVPVRTMLAVAFLSTPLLAQFSQQGPKLMGTGADGAVLRGQSVAMSADGNTAIVGGYGDNGDLGAAWIFTRTLTGWTQLGSKLVAADSVGASRQGYSVAISGDGNTAMVGGYGDSGNAGAAWIYIRAGAVFIQQAKLVGTGAVGTARQGWSVALSMDGNTALVGGEGDNGNAGAAWVFTRGGESWSQDGSKLVGTGAVGSAHQGQSVSLAADGSTALVGGSADNGYVGAAWVYARSGPFGAFVQAGAKLVGTGAIGAAYQGQSVALSGDGTTAMVGGRSDNGGVGAAWVYARTGDVFTQLFTQLGTKLVGTGAVGAAFQGSSVSLSYYGDTAAVGGFFDAGAEGAAWVYTRSGDTFAQQGSKLVGTGAVGAALQGASVSLSMSGDRVIVGGYGDDASSGAAWVFARSGGVWTQEGSKLAASGAARQGYSVSLSNDGNTAILGGYTDYGGVGAAWIFTRSAGAWMQQGSKLVATDASGAAYQGSSVALSGDGNTAIVGGYANAGNAGAAWIFTRSGGVWTQQGTVLTGADAVGTALQGTSVALSWDGNTALVGGPGDDGNAGAAWVFTRSGNVFTQQGTKLVGTGATGSAGAGRAVALSGDGNTAMLGGNFDSGGVGAAWVFARGGSVFTQQGTKLVGTGAAGTAYQGGSVSLSANGNTAIVGGYYDNSFAGAAWVFMRSADVWAQQGSKLVGSSALGAAQQGQSVALSGDGTTAIVGGPRDNALAGAAWVYTQPAAPTSLYVTFPCRILDTRDPAGPLGGPGLQPGTSRSFPVLASACGIPPTARALSVNVTVTQPAAAGYVQMDSADQPTPGTSVVDFSAGRTRANNAVVRLPGDGSGNISVFHGSAGGAHFIMDVNGYFQ